MMGYDMYWHAPREDDNAALPGARAAFHAACAARNLLPTGSAAEADAQKLVDAAFTDMRQAERTYFRLNIWGMSATAQYMAERDMLCDAPAPGRDEWPEYVEEGEPGYDEYERAHRALASDHRGECPGIPAYKFGSNDGWIVLPGEITAALRANDKHEPPSDCEWWGRWIEWMRDAIDRDGFEVH